MSNYKKQIPSTRLGLLTSSTIGAVVLDKSMQQLLHQIDQVQIDVENCIKTLEKIDTRREKVIMNRDRSIEGRRQIKTLIEHIINLHQQMNIMTKESDSNWPVKTYDKTKQNALKILSNLLKKLNQIDKHLEKVTGTISSEIKYTKNIASVDKDMRRTPSLSESDEETTSDEDIQYTVTEKKQKQQNASRLTKKIEISSNESDDEDNTYDNYKLINEFQNKKFLDDHLTDSNNSHRQLHTSSPSFTNKKPPTFKIHSSSSSLSSISIKTSSSIPLSRKKSPNLQQFVVVPSAKQDDKSEDDSSFEEEEEGNQSDVVDAYVQKLRIGKYLPGTKFRVTNNLKAHQTGDLTIYQDEILILIEQKADDWWLFKHPQTHLQGLVPINHIQLLSYQIKPTTSSSSTLVDVFKTNNYIPSGFILSDLAALTKQNRYKLFHTLMPRMSESNFVFSDLYWRYDKDQIYIQQAKYQKILTIKKCLKIPKIKGEHINVLNRCIRICLYDGLEIISNIHSTRVEISNKLNENNLTENWYFTQTNSNTSIDEQSKFLIRSNEYHPTKHLYLLLELSQLCQSNITKELCEIGSGWLILSLDNHNQTKNYNKLLQGGHIYQKNILLNSQYKHFHTDGLTGKIHRYKKARIIFTIQSRESFNDIFYDILPLTSMIIPINLIEIICFYRNELAYQYQKYSYSNNVSTKPIDSIFLTTFYQTLEQPDLIYVLQRLCHRHKKPIKREEFLKIYESFIYPLLFYRLLQPYNFHDISIINQRRKLISEIIAEESGIKNNKQPDILTILLDPNLTDKWTPFTTDEICFSLQKYSLSKP